MIQWLRLTGILPDTVCLLAETVDIPADYIASGDALAIT